MADKPICVRLLDLGYTERTTEDLKEEGNLFKLIESPIYKSSLQMNSTLNKRGCRYGIFFPEVYNMQIEAIMEAACLLSKNDNIEVLPEIALPFISTVEEIIILRHTFEKVIKRVFEKTEVTVPYKIGSIIEIPRACLVADKLAKHMDFFIFGIKNLTQLTFGFNLNELINPWGFLFKHIEHEILPKNPFNHLDINGVGKLIDIAVKKIKKSSPDKKIGVNLDDSEDISSICFYHKIGLDYLICPVDTLLMMRLAVVQASITGSNSNSG